MNYSKVTFLPVDNGNMVLIKLNDTNNTTILYDMYIREKSTDENDESYDVLQYLKDHLEKDADNRPFVDVFVLSHHDDDHIRGFENYFHTDALEKYKDKDEKIYIKEIWGSARFLKRASTFNKLEKDAKAFNKEMNRRFNLFNDTQEIQDEGCRIQILGSCPDGGTKGCEDIVYEMGENITYLNEKLMSSKINVNLLGPVEQLEGEDEKEFKQKNRGSVILQMNVIEAAYTHKILLTGDAEVDVCEDLENTYSQKLLEYDILQAPHHCSKYSLYNKISDEDSEISQKACDALSHNRVGAKIVASCREFGKDTPPHKEAKDEYIKIVGKENFIYTAGNKFNKEVRPVEIELTKDGIKKSASKTSSIGLAAGTKAGGEARGHG